MTIFYNHKALNDTMLIAFNNAAVHNTKSFDNYEILLSKDDKLVGVNVFNVSRYINLDEGMIYPTSEVLEFLKKITQIDFREYVKPNFVVAKVLECEEVQGTHLHKCQVELGNNLGVVQIVCGAINVRTGLKTVCATVGAFMPSGNYIAEGKLMSIESNGMLCSFKELHLENVNSQPGIIELDDRYHFYDEFKDVYVNC